MSRETCCTGLKTRFHLYPPYTRCVSSSISPLHKMCFLIYIPLTQDVFPHLYPPYTRCVSSSISPLHKMWFIYIPLTQDVVHLYPPYTRCVSSSISPLHKMCLMVVVSAGELVSDGELLYCLILLYFVWIGTIIWRLLWICSYIHLWWL